MFMGLFSVAVHVLVLICLLGVVLLLDCDFGGGFGSCSDSVRLLRVLLGTVV